MFKKSFLFFYNRNSPTHACAPQAEALPTDFSAGNKYTPS